MKTKLSPKTKTRLSTRQVIRIAVLSTAGAGLFVAIILFVIANTGTSQSASALPTPDTNSDYVLNMNGTTGDVMIGNKALPIDSQLTIVALVKWTINPTEGNSWSNIISCNSNVNSDDGRFWLQHNSNNSKFEFSLQTTTGRTVLFSNTTPNPQQWYHLACTYDGQKMRIFVNGVEENSISKTGLIRANRSDYFTIIGAWANSNSNYRRFKGYINNVAIYRRALTSVQINQLKCSDLSSTLFSPVAAWPVNENDGDFLHDITGNKFNGTYRNSAPILVTKVDCSTLPVEMISFTAKADKNAVTLDWATASEKNNDRFAIERSFDGTEFENVGTVEGSGNSNIRVDYSFTDYPAEYNVVYYRIRQIDFDGQFTIYGPVSVSKNDISRDYRIYPNPLPYSEKVKIEGITSEDVVEFVDANGISHFESQSLIPGNYFVKINGKLISRLVVVK